MHRLLNIQDFIIVPFLLGIIYIIADRIQQKHIDEKAYYSYLKKGLFVKIGFGFAFAAVYLLYYGGGDTTAYFDGTVALSNMAGYSFKTFLKLMGGDNSIEVLSVFNRETGYSYYLGNDHTFQVIRFNLLFYWLGFGSYIGNTIVYCFVLFFGFWKFFELLNTLYPNNERYFAIVLFYLPSAVFWSSGILKDGWCISAAFYIYYFIHGAFIEKKKIYRKLFWLIVWSYIAMVIRPYVFYIAFGTAILWVAYANLKIIDSKFLRAIAMPFVLVISLGGGAFVITQMGDSLGGRNYSSVDAMLNQAWVIQDDLTRDYYGSNSFNIGSFDPTIPGVVSKFPVAVIAGLLRPFLWEARNPLMILSGIESFVIMLFMLYFLFKPGLKSMLRFIITDPLVRSFFIFALIFAFVCGLTTANFGALVRYRILAEVMQIVGMVIVFANTRLKKENA